MSILYLDTEFNGFCGRLISMALVLYDNSVSFYEVLPEDTYYNPAAGYSYDPFVVDNVLPVLNKEPISVSEFQSKLEKFLNDHSEYGRITVVADWPEDITHFTKMLIRGLGVSLNIPEIRFVLNNDLRRHTIHSLIPHNALEDARAIARLDDSSMYN